MSGGEVDAGRISKKDMMSSFLVLGELSAGGGSIPPKERPSFGNGSAGADAGS